MTTNELSSLKESVSRIEKFAPGYPKLITDVPEKWLPYFQWGYNLCVDRQKELGINSEEQMKLVV